MSSVTPSSSGSGTGAVFKTSIGDKDYSMKVFITKEDNKGFGHKTNLPWTECKEINDMNVMLNELRNKLYPRLPTVEQSNTQVLVYPYMDAKPPIKGEIHHVPWDKWEVNEDFINHGVSPQWISDFLKFSIEGIQNMSMVRWY